MDLVHYAMYLNMETIIISSFSFLAANFKLVNIIHHLFNSFPFTYLVIRIKFQEMEFLKIQNYNTLMKSIVLLLLCVVHVNAQVTLPSRQDGFWYKNRIANTESILIEAFFDPLCPDSRDSWPPLKLALQHYGSRLSLVVHPFPLPYVCSFLNFTWKNLVCSLVIVQICRYHDNAFISSRALHISNQLNTSATYRLLESFFDHQV